MALAAIMSLERASPGRGASLPEKSRKALAQASDFLLKGVHLNGAAHHPLPVRSANALRDYALARARSEFDPGEHGHAAYALAIRELASLLNAGEDELMLVPSASYGESLLVAALGLATGPGRVVTDALHWKSSLFQYAVLAERGLDLAIVPDRHGSIDKGEIAAAITPGTRLVAVSLVSYISGFEHDLATLAELAHRHGAFLYADVTQAAGALPIDLKASGVDFCAGAGYKWLMGEAGAGFLYARADAQRRLERRLCGSHQLAAYSVSSPPGAASARIAYQAKPGIEGRLAIGSISNAATLALGTSLGLINELGPDRISAHRQPLLDRLEDGMSALGFERLTPARSRAPIATYRIADAAARLAPHLRRAAVDVTLGADKLRVSPSVYNRMDDIEALLLALKSYRDGRSG